MDPATISGALIGLLIATLVNAIVIWIVGKMGIGIKINNFGTAFMAAFLIALIWILLDYFGIMKSSGGGFTVHLVRLIVSALVLMLVGSMLKGMVTKGFFGAIIAALAMTAVFWLIGTLLAKSLHS